MVTNNSNPEKPRRKNGSIFQCLQRTPAGLPELHVHFLAHSLWEGECGNKDAYNFMKTQISPKKKLPQCTTMCNMLGTSVIKSGEKVQDNTRE